MIDACLTCVLSECNDRDPRCAFVQIKPRVVQAERDAERLEKRSDHNRRMYLAKRATILESRKARYHADPKKDNERSRRWFEANRDRKSGYDRERYERLKQSA